MPLTLIAGPDSATLADFARPALVERAYPPRRYPLRPSRRGRVGRARAIHTDRHEM